MDETAMIGRASEKIKASWKGEETMMNEKEIIGLILEERIQGILKQGSVKMFACMKPGWEELQEVLNNEQQELADGCLNALISQQSQNEKQIYLEGVKDGITLLNWIRKVCEGG